MNKSISAFLSPLHRTLTRRQSIGLVVCCTLIGAAAQIFMKIGANNLPPLGPVAIMANPWIVLRNSALLGGLTLYGFFTLMLIFALRDGELSIIYPVIALTYVWVTFLSLLFFHETMNPLKASGILVIVLGVVILGRGSGH